MKEKTMTAAGFDGVKGLARHCKRWLDSVTTPTPQTLKFHMYRITPKPGTVLVPKHGPLLG